MFEAYAVGVSLKLTDLVTPQLLKLAREFEKIDVLANRIQANLKGIGADAAGVRAIATAANASARAMERASIAALTLEQRIAAIRAAGTIPAMTPIPSRVIPSGGGGGGGRGGYSGQAGGLHGGRIHAGSNGIALGAFSYGLGGEALLPMAITAGAGLMAYKGYKSARDFQLEVARFRALGLSDSMNADALNYVKNLKAYGVSRAQEMELFRDAQTIFRDSNSLHHAEMVTPLLARMRFANETLYGGEHASSVEAKFMDMLKVIELRKGLVDLPTFETQANMIQQVLTTSGGRVDSTQYLNLIKTGGVAAKSLSNEALYYQLEPIIQEMGGFRVGTGLMSAYQNLIVGRLLGKRPAAELMRLGLLDPKKVTYGNTGAIKEFQPGALKGSEILQQSPVDFLEQILLPAFSKAGITEEQDVLRELAVIFSNRTASNLFSTIYQQLPVIRKGEKASAQALSIDKAYELSLQTATGNEQEFAAAWADFKTSFGTAVLPQATKLLHGGADLFNALDRFVTTNQAKLESVRDGMFGYAKWVWTGGPTGMLIRKFMGGGESESPYVKSANSSPVQVSTQVNLDGRAIANVVSQHQAKSILNPTGISGFDAQMSPIPLGLNSAR